MEQQKRLPQEIMTDPHFKESVVKKSVWAFQAGDQNELKQRGTRKHPLLGGIRPSSVSQGHWVRDRVQKLRLKREVGSSSRKIL